MSYEMILYLNAERLKRAIQCMQDMYLAIECHHGDRNSLIGIFALLDFTICFEAVQIFFSKKKKNDHLDEFSFRLFGKKSLI